MPRNKSGRKNFFPNDQDIASAETVIETTSAVFADGTALEMVLDSEWRNEPRLLAWNGKEATISKRFEHNDKVYLPPKLNAPLLQALRLPTKIPPTDQLAICSTNSWHCSSATASCRKSVPAKLSIPSLPAG